MLIFFVNSLKKFLNKKYVVNLTLPTRKGGFYMDFYKREICPVREEIEKFIDSKDFFNTIKKYQSDYFVLYYYDILKRYCKGGKCIRGYLVKLGYNVLGEHNDGNIIYASVAYELFETSILAHDDIIDRSPIRRMAPSLHVALGNNHKGLSRSLCVGDAGMLMANAFLMESNFPIDVCLKALKHQVKIFSHTLSGELNDIDLSYSDTYSEKEILDMYILKTSLYTISGPLMMGSILAGASEDAIEVLRKFGLNLGIAFQIVDDILGIFGSENIIGKSVTSDICEGKKSILTFYFNQNSTEQKYKEFYSIYGKSNVSQAEINIIRENLMSCGALDYAKEKANYYSKKACSIIEAYDFSDEYIQILLGLCKYLINRNM